MMILFLVFAALLPAAEVYTIGSEDVLTIHVWKEPEISRRVSVRPDGKISLPLVNDVQAAGLTAGQLARQLSEGLKKYLTEADVAVVVEQVNSRKFYVMGEVVRPGAYPLLVSTTVLQALTAASGFRDFARTKKIDVLKARGQRLRFDYQAVVKGKKPEQNIFLEPGDTIIVP